MDSCCDRMCSVKQDTAQHSSEKEPIVTAELYGTMTVNKLFEVAGKCKTIGLKNTIFAV